MATEDVALITLSPDTVVPGAVSLLSLRVTSTELAQRAHLEWDAAEDEMGVATTTVVQAGPDGAPFVLLEYPESPGVVVLGPADAEDHALDSLLRVLGIDESEIEDRPVDLAIGTRPEELTLELALLRLRTAEFAGELAALRNELAHRGRDAPSGAALTAGQRDALTLVANGHTYDEIAQMLRVSPAAVRARIARARQRLSST